VRHDTLRTGVCVVRIQAQGDVLITVRTNADIEQVSTERVVTLADIETAVQTVRRFLTAFAEASKGR
jgi:hypothetical protein